MKFDVKFSQIWIANLVGRSIDIQDPFVFNLVGKKMSSFVEAQEDGKLKFRKFLEPWLQI